MHLTEKVRKKPEQTNTLLTILRNDDVSELKEYLEKHPHSFFVKLFKSSNYSVTAFQRAFELSARKCIKFLLENHFESHPAYFKDSVGKYSVIKLCSTLEDIKLLHGYGIPLEQKESSIILSFIRRFGIDEEEKIKIIEYLIKHGANTKFGEDPIDKDMSILFYAASSHQTKIMELLVNNGADIHHRDVLGRDILDIFTNSIKEGKDLKTVSKIFELGFYKCKNNFLKILSTETIHIIDKAKYKERIIEDIIEKEHFHLLDEQTKNAFIF